MNTEFIGKLKSSEKLLGTCFMINPSYILSAYHNIEDLQNYEELNIEFENINNLSNLEVVYTNKDIDLVVLKSEVLVESEIDYMDIYYTLPIEEDDRWKSYGYPQLYEEEEIKSEYVKGEINRIIQNKIYDLELNILNQKDESDWSGMSGAPLVMDNKIVGIIIKESTSMLQNELKAISIQKIISCLYDNDENDLLKQLYYKKENYLTKRCETFKNECSDKFHIYRKNSAISSSYFILKPGFSDEDIMEIIDIFLTDYANNLQDSNKINFSDLKSRRLHERHIETIKNDIKNMLIKYNKFIFVLLWFILEGIFETPRIASMISLTKDGLKRDVFINVEDNSIQFLIGYAESQDDILKTIKSIIGEINEELQLKIPINNLLIWDELAINCLDITTRKTISKIKEISNDDTLSIDIVILNSYESDIYNHAAYRIINNNSKLLESICDVEIESVELEISKLNDSYEWLNVKNVEWVMVPTKSLKAYNAAL